MYSGVFMVRPCACPRPKKVEQMLIFLLQVHLPRAHYRNTYFSHCVPSTQMH